jgi:hypothetical protein
MTHFFERAMGRLFRGKLAQDARYRPRQGADIDLLRANGQGVIPVTDADFDAGLDRMSQTAPKLVFDAPASAFETAAVTPGRNDVLMLDAGARLVKSAERRDDGLVWRLTLGELA